MDKKSFRSICLLPLADTATGLGALFVASLGHGDRGI